MDGWINRTDIQRGGQTYSQTGIQTYRRTGRGDGQSGREAYKRTGKQVER